MEQNSEQTVFQLYTIINDPSTSLVLENQNLQENLYEIGEDDGSVNQIVYIALQQDDEVDEQVKTTFDKPDENEELPQHISNMKLVTLENGQVYLTTENSPEDNLVAVQPHLLSNNADELTTIDEVHLPTKEDPLETTKDDKTSDFHEIQLEDGTHAIINADLWNSLIEGATTVEEPGATKKKRFPCMYVGCGKSFTTSHHLSVHIRSHTGKRPFACTAEGCDKAFATGYSLKAHLRTHTGEKPYGCHVCLKRFKTSGDLQKHVRTHTGEKPFKCPIEGCDKSFTTSNIRKVHIRSHTGERPYTCQVVDCGKAFASATNYKNHMRIHSGEKPYVCHVDGCGKRFTEYSSLYKHSAVHQPYRNFRCNYCSLYFKFENTLRLHKKTVHNVIVTENGTEFVVAEDNEQSLVLEFTDPAYLKSIKDPLLLSPIKKEFN
ncbi:hypothetical protein ILUMI_12374 [Ignelater luminosus]|uniref:C2H2-type domain-containing protein n=1 Tax=Ignelater luminosus TaxID=2038154 RepID=A0A8K0G6U0_IGNLU|nr:hypothetical protein ILUMI_12374 [Ignelater luminosus]